MILFPAVDIQKGLCVRLRQGKEDAVTVFSSDPVAMALHWQNQGARWLHVIDLDGAFSGKPVNLELITKITQALDIPVQLGGGIRDENIAAQYFSAGVARLIIGTMALEEPAKYAALCEEFPGKIGVSLDAENGQLKTKGWVQDAGMTIDAALPAIIAAGTAFIIYTDIARDGMQVGVNLPALTKLATSSPVPIIAAGGVHTLDDIKALYPLSVSANLEGVISGKAIYEGTLNLAEAQAWIAAQ